MGQTFIVACNRCGAPNSEFAKDWVYTKDKVWLHACADGIMGGAKEFEVWESRPVLAPTPRQPIPIEPSSPKVYLVPGGLYHQRHGRHFTQCHGCPLELSGEYNAADAKEWLANRFVCPRCHNWQIWTATPSVKHPGILIWKLANYSKIEKPEKQATDDAMMAVAIAKMEAMVEAAKAPKPITQWQGISGSQIFSNAQVVSFAKDARHVSKSIVQPAARPR